MTIAWEFKCASHTQKLVLISLADNANDEGHCWPSIPTIARKCDLSRQGVMIQVRKLEENGVLKITKSSGKSNCYQLTIPVNRIDPSTALTGQPRGLPPVTHVDRHPSTALTGPVNGVDPNRKEPSVEPSEGTVKPNRRRGSSSKKSKSVDPRHQPFIEGWCDAYADVFGEKYPFAGGKDGKAVKRLLEKTKKSTEELVSLARMAWDSEKKLGRFQYQNSLTIPGFESNLSVLTVELNGKAQKISDKFKNPVSSDTL